MLFLAVRRQVTRACGLATEHLAEFANDELMRRVRTACATCAQRDRPAEHRPTTTPARGEAHGSRNDQQPSSCDPHDAGRSRTSTLVTVRRRSSCTASAPTGRCGATPSGCCTRSVDASRSTCRCTAAAPVARRPGSVAQRFADASSGVLRLVRLDDIDLVAHDTGGAVAQIVARATQAACRTLR